MHSNMFDKPSRRRRALALVLVAMAMLMLVGFAALAVDLGLVWSTDGALQAVADAASLAGASGIHEGPEEARARARDYAEEHVLGSQQITLQDSDIELGLWDRDARTFTQLTGDDEALADSVRVSVAKTTERGNAVDLIFAPLVGHSSIDITATATAQFGAPEQTWDVVIVQDVSYSFAAAVERAAEADEALLGCLIDHVDNESKVGLVVYSGTALTMVPLLPIDSGAAQLIEAIQDITACCWFCSSWTYPEDWPRCATGTNIGEGIYDAVDLFAEAGSDPEIGKAIVVVSDGKPQATEWYPVPTEAERDQLAIDAADHAWSMGISVSTVYYAGSSSSPEIDAEFLEGLVRGEGTFHATPDPEDLGALLWQVCASLPLRLVD